MARQLTSEKAKIGGIIVGPRVSSLVCKPDHRDVETSSIAARYEVPAAFAELLDGFAQL